MNEAHPAARGSKAGGGGKGGKGGAHETTRILQEFSVDPQLITVERRVGSGCFGDVYQGRFQGTRVAIKSLKHVDETTIVSFRAEALLHSVLHHPNVIFFVGICWGRGLTGMLLEWAERGSLMDVLFDKSTTRDFGRRTLVASAKAAAGKAVRRSAERRKSGSVRRQMGKGSSDCAPSSKGGGGDGDDVESATTPENRSARGGGGGASGGGASGGASGGNDGVDGIHLSWQDPLLRMATDIARGMVYLHAKRWFDESSGMFRECVVHRDLKPDNLLVTPTFSIKITDFGLSRPIDREALMSAVGTPLFAAPELFRSERYDESCDVYSFGLVLLQLSIDEPLIEYITREYCRSKYYNPAKGKAKWMEIGRTIVMEHWRPRTFEGAPESVKQLIKLCWDPDPARRPTFPAILEALETTALHEVSRRFASRSQRPNEDEQRRLRRFIDDGGGGGGGGAAARGRTRSSNPELHSKDLLKETGPAATASAAAAAAAGEGRAKRTASRGRSDSGFLRRVQSDESLAARTGANHGTGPPPPKPPPPKPPPPKPPSKPAAAASASAAPAARGARESSGRPNSPGRPSSPKGRSPPRSDLV